jgi:hypothetical protein
MAITLTLTNWTSAFLLSLYTEVLLLNEFHGKCFDLVLKSPKEEISLK